MASLTGAEPGHVPNDAINHTVLDFVAVLSSSSNSSDNVCVRTPAANNSDECTGRD